MTGSVSTKTDYVAANLAMNGTLLVKLEGQFSIGDATNVAQLYTSRLRKVSASAFT